MNLAAVNYLARKLRGPGCFLYDAVDGMPMGTHLQEKTDKYEQLLAAALDSTSMPANLDDGASQDAEECYEMAQAYLDDGRHFREAGDWPNALAAFSYGHGWLDAGIRFALLDGPAPAVPPKDD